jgi:hypothetical protein
MGGLVSSAKQKYDHVQKEICNVGQSLTSFGKLRIGAEETREASGEGMKTRSPGNAASGSRLPNSTAVESSIEAGKTLGGLRAFGRRCSDCRMPHRGLEETALSAWGCLDARPQHLSIVAGPPWLRRTSIWWTACLRLPEAFTVTIIFNVSPPVPNHHVTGCAVRAQETSS